MSIIKGVHDKFVTHSSDELELDFESFDLGIGGIRKGLGGEWDGSSYCAGNSDELAARVWGGDGERGGGCGGEEEIGRCGEGREGSSWGEDL